MDPLPSRRRAFYLFSFFFLIRRKKRFAERTKASAGEIEGWTGKRGAIRRLDRGKMKGGLLFVRYLLKGSWTTGEREGKG